MKSHVYNKLGSEFHGKTLKEILDIIEDRPLFTEKVENAKKLFERIGYPEKFNAMREVK